MAEWDSQLEKNHEHTINRLDKEIRRIEQVIAHLPAHGDGDALSDHFLFWDLPLNLHFSAKKRALFAGSIDRAFEALDEASDELAKMRQGLDNLQEEKIAAYEDREQEREADPYTPGMSLTDRPFREDNPDDPDGEWDDPGGLEYR